MTADTPPAGGTDDPAAEVDASPVGLPRVVRDVRALTSPFEVTAIPLTHHDRRPFTGILGLEPRDPVEGPPTDLEAPAAGVDGDALRASVVPDGRRNDRHIALGAGDAGEGANETGAEAVGDDGSGMDADEEPRRVRDLIRAESSEAREGTDGPVTTGRSMEGEDRSDGPAHPPDAPTLRADVSVTPSDAPTGQSTDPSARPDDPHRTSSRRDGSDRSTGGGRPNEADTTGAADATRTTGATSAADVISAADANARSAGPSPRTSDADRSSPTEDSRVERIERSNPDGPDPPPMTPLRAGRRLTSVISSPASSGERGRASRSPDGPASPLPDEDRPREARGSVSLDDGDGGTRAGGDGPTGSNVQAGWTDAPALDGLELAERVDVDRLSDRLATVLERNARIERERRGR